MADNVWVDHAAVVTAAAATAAATTHVCMFEYTDDFQNIYTSPERFITWFGQSMEVERADHNGTMTMMPWVPCIYVDSRLKSYAWAPRFTAPISIIASVIILWIILRDRTKLAKTRYRLLFGMSVVDLINSVALGLSSAPTPAGTMGSYGAIGTRATCTAQGFFVQAGFAEPVYSCMLSLYFVLVIHFRLRENFIRRRIEPFMHAVAILYPLGTAFAGLGLDIFNSSQTICWIEPYPHGCSTDYPTTKSCNCTRGLNAFIYQLAFGGGPLLLIFLVIVACMIFIMVTVARIERRIRMLNVGAPPSSRDAHQIKAAAMSTQAVMYIVAFLITYFLPIFVTIATEFQLSVPHAMHLLCYALTPLQGLWNFVAFMHPRWKFARSTNPRESRWRVFRLALDGDRGGWRGRGRRGGAPEAGVSAFNGEFQRRQFQICTASMRTTSSREGADAYDDDFSDDDSFNYGEPRRERQQSDAPQRQSYTPRSAQYQVQRRERVELSTYSSYYDSGGGGASYFDSDVAVDVSSASQAVLKSCADLKKSSLVAGAPAGLGSIGSSEALESTPGTAACSSECRDTTYASTSSGPRQPEVSVSSSCALASDEEDVENSSQGSDTADSSPQEDDCKSSSPREDDCKSSSPREDEC